MWLTQAKMAELFEVQKAAISKHLKNIFASGELPSAVLILKRLRCSAFGQIEY